MPRWTYQDVAALASDDTSIAAARKLATPAPWHDTGSTDVLVWGKCQGSGSTPYQVSVDLTGSAFKCTCPSRKFPCKHGLALLMLWVDGGGVIADTSEAAEFAQSWHEDRSARAARSESRKTGSEGPVDPEAQARRAAQRVARMDAGADEFERWLGDLVRDGLAGARQRDYAFWDTAAARLVDAQLPGLAERVRAMGGDVHRRDDWADHLLAESGRWFCALAAWRQRDRLADDELGDLRAFVGWAMSIEQVLAGDRVTDSWTVLGVHRTDDGRLQAQRTWVVGAATGSMVLLLDFAAVGGSLRVPHVTGTVIEADLALYPGSAPRRGAFATEPRPVGRSVDLPTPGSIDAALAARAERLASGPWSDRIPTTLRGAFTARSGQAFVDLDGAALPLAAGTDVWRLLALTGGAAIDVFAELDSGEIRPLSVRVEDRLVAV